MLEPQGCRGLELSLKACSSHHLFLCEPVAKIDTGSLEAMAESDAS
ncbi:MAG: hypothetical protein KGI33_04970 [Thaumarchaeota archaeon]|nr:hypothetical protein [Nitrososphaerota archaeon]